MKVYHQMSVNIYIYIKKWNFSYVDDVEKESFVRESEMRKLL